MAFPRALIPRTGQESWVLIWALSLRRGHVSELPSPQAGDDMEMK